MISYAILLLELLLIFFTSRFIFQSFYSLLYRLTKSQKISFSLLSAFFFPGTLIHEMSHMIAAVVVRVPVHGMEFTPEYHNGSLKMGSVKIQKTDALRSLIIGGAPFITGVCMLLASLWYLLGHYKISDIFSSVFVFGITLCILYLLFVITNTMFSSKRDVDGIWIFVVLVGAVLVVLYLLGLHPEVFIYNLLRRKLLIESAWNIVYFISIPLIINVIVLCMALLITRKR